MTRRIWADFNGLFGNLLCISHSDSAPDENGARVELREGMVVTAFMEDEDTAGVRDDLLATGIVERAPEELRCLGSRWVLRIDSAGVRNQSQVVEGEEP
jgi:hypothetical protein